MTRKGIHLCKIYWYGTTQRAEFFHQCLKKFPYGRMNKKVPYLISEMRWIGTKLKRAEQAAGQLVSGSAAQISGGLLSLEDSRRILIGVGKLTESSHSP